ncbi:MAG TPA: ornithine carbamoyltransferase [Thermoanaerobaculia bacterium]|nr:ornithine carbamoyltransferase [Thermoanaerobaculia bacterium]
MSQPSDLAGRVERAQQLLDERKAQKAKPRSFLTLADLTREEMRTLLDGGLEIKRHPERFAQTLAGRSVGLLFQKTSTRTRVSFEIGVGEMGGQPLYVDWRTSNFTLADLEDEIRVFSRYVDLVMARVYGHEDLELMARESEVPVINGLSDLYHPCQGLADYMTILEYFGETEGLKIAYVGDGNNVCHTLIWGAARSGMSISVAYPRGYSPDAGVVSAARASGATVELTHSPEEAVADADVVYTDTWISMGDEAQRDARLRAFAGFTVDEALLAKAPAHALVMHCLPAHRGYEISGAALDSRNSVVLDEAENRKHAQKFLMAWLLGHGG